MATCFAQTPCLSVSVAFAAGHRYTGLPYVRTLRHGADAAAAAVDARASSVLRGTTALRGTLSGKASGWGDGYWRAFDKLRASVAKAVDATRRDYPDTIPAGTTVPGAGGGGGAGGGAGEASLVASAAAAERSAAERSEAERSARALTASLSHSAASLLSPTTAASSHLPPLHPPSSPMPSPATPPGASAFSSSSASASSGRHNRTPSPTIPEDGGRDSEVTTAAAAHDGGFGGAGGAGGLPRGVAAAAAVADLAYPASEHLALLQPLDASGYGNSDDDDDDCENGDEVGDSGDDDGAGLRDSSSSTSSFSSVHVQRMTSFDFKVDSAARDACPKQRADSLFARCG